MAGLQDVINVLGGLVQQAVYPTGIMNPSIIGSDVIIEGGWPIRSQLDKDLQEGKAHISIFPTNNTRDTTRFERVYQPLQQSAATITATVTDNKVLIGGTVTIPQAVMIIVNGVGYGYQLLITDTLSSIAKALSELIPNSISIGPTIIIENPISIIARIATNYSSIEELSRQERVFLISCWASGDNTIPEYDPTIRDVLADAIDQIMKLNYRIVMPDGFYACLFFVEAANPYIDYLEQSLVMRRDLNYKIEYATTIINNYTTITNPMVNTTIVQAIT